MKLSDPKNKNKLYIDFFWWWKNQKKKEKERELN